MSSSSSRRRSHRRGQRQPAPLEAEAEIDRLGAGGDGVGEWRGAPLYVPGLLPGERARVGVGPKRGAGRLAETIARLTDAPERVAPPCPYAEACGGCTLQHLAYDAYLAWKDGLLDQALAQRGLAPERRGALIRIEAGRRRLRFAARGRERGAVLGFNGKGSGRIVDIARCIAAEPALADAPTRLRPFLEALLRPGETADLDVRASAAGLDVVLVRRRPLDLGEREAAAAFVAEEGIARLAWLADDRDAPEIVAERKASDVDLGRLRVTPPPGAFLQPTAGGEAAMAAFAADWLKGSARVADLYAGWGAFALRLADPMHVEAFEGDAAMIEALKRAAFGAGLGGFVQATARDLARQPLLGAELKRFDAVLLDPPRAGAPEQSAALAADGPALVVYLSCNPAALARDARTLVDGGYRLVEATPIDQFRWTPHLEVAARFERPRA